MGVRDLSTALAEQVIHMLAARLPPDATEADARVVRRPRRVGLKAMPAGLAVALLRGGDVDERSKSEMFCGTPSALRVRRVRSCGRTSAACREQTVRPGQNDGCGWECLV